MLDVGRLVAMVGEGAGQLRVFGMRLRIVPADAFFLASHTPGEGGRTWRAGSGGDNFQFGFRRFNLHKALAGLLAKMVQAVPGKLLKSSLSIQFDLVEASP